MFLAVLKKDILDFVNIEGTLDEYYNLIECDCIDIVTRRIGDTYFDIICDDEGLLKDNPRVSAVDLNGNPMLVGNLIFSHTNDEGETTAITDDDISVIMDAINIAYTDDDEIIGLVVKLDY